MAWRLPLTRTLASLRAVATEQVQAATEKAARGGLFVSCLIEAGADANKVLTAYAVATGLPSAPRYETRNPPTEMGTRGDGDLFRSLLCVPFKEEKGTLCIAFAAPLPAEMTAQLPPHKAFVALEHEVVHGLDTLFPRWKMRPSAPPAPQPIPAPVAAASAPPPDAAPTAPVPELNTVDLAPAPDAAPPIETAGPPAIKTGKVVPTTVPIMDPNQPAYPGAVLAAKTVRLTTPSGEHQPVSPVPSGPQRPVPPPPANVVVDAAVPMQEDRYGELKDQLKVLRVPAAVIVGLVVLFKLGSWLMTPAPTVAPKPEPAKTQPAAQPAQPQTAAEYLERGQRPPPQPLEPPKPAAEPVAAVALGNFDSVNAALTDANLSAQSGANSSFPEKCRALSAELVAYRSRNKLGPREQVDVAMVNKEVDAACEKENGGGDFGPIKERVSKALRGEPIDPR
jgi:hypothetical protein